MDEEGLRIFLYNVYGYGVIERFLSGDIENLSKSLEGTIIGTFDNSEFYYRDLKELSRLIKKKGYPRISHIKRLEDSKRNWIKDRFGIATESGFYIGNMAFWVGFNHKEVKSYLDSKVLPHLKGLDFVMINPKKKTGTWLYGANGERVLLYVSGSSKVNKKETLFGIDNYPDLIDGINDLVDRYYEIVDNIK